MLDHIDIYGHRIDLSRDIGRYCLGWPEASHVFMAGLENSPVYVFIIYPGGELGELYAHIRFVIVFYVHRRLCAFLKKVKEPCQIPGVSHAPIPKLLQMSPVVCHTMPPPPLWQPSSRHTQHCLARCGVACDCKSSSDLDHPIAKSKLPG